MSTLTSLPGSWPSSVRIAARGWRASGVDRRAGTALLAVRLLALAGLAAAGMLLADYAHPEDAAFCGGARSGCAAVRAAALASLRAPAWSVPLVGLAGLGSLLGLALSRSARALRWLRVAALAGAAAAATLLGEQLFVIGRVCSLCLVVDLAVIAIAVLCPSARPPGERRLRPWAWAALAGCAALAPSAWWLVRPPLPAGVRALHAGGKVNVVEFTDHECPYCRLHHEALRVAIAELGEGRVHLVRLQVPLPMHPGAYEAARASVCAEAEGALERMEAALYAADGHAREASVELARAAGADTARFAACLADPRTDARVDAEIRLFRRTGAPGLPATYVGDRRLDGAQSVEVLRRELRRAMDSRPREGVPAPAFLAALAASCGAVLLLGLRREPLRPRPPGLSRDAASVTSPGRGGRAAG